MRRLVNAGIIQNWVFDSNETADSWIRRKENDAVGQFEVLVKGECKQGYGVTCMVQYNQTCMTSREQLMAIGAVMVWED